MGQVIKCLDEPELHFPNYLSLAPLLLPPSSISPLAVMWYYMLMGQWTEKKWGNQAWPLVCIMDCLCELPLKDTKTWENSTSLQDTWLQRTWWDSNVSSAELVNLKNVPLTSVMSPGCSVKLIAVVRSSSVSLPPPRRCGKCATKTGQESKTCRAGPVTFAQFVPHQVSSNGKRCAEADSLTIAGSSSLGRLRVICVQVCECVCGCRRSKRSHQAWLCVIHTDKFQCSLSPLIVRRNQPVERDMDRETEKRRVQPDPPRTRTHILRLYLCVDLHRQCPYTSRNQLVPNPNPNPFIPTPNTNQQLKEWIFKISIGKLN